MKKPAKKEVKPKQVESVDACATQWAALTKERKAQIVEALTRSSDANGPQSFSALQHWCRNAISGSVHWMTGLEIAGALAVLEKHGRAKLTSVKGYDYWLVTRGK